MKSVFFTSTIQIYLKAINKPTYKQSANHIVNTMLTDNIYCCPYMRMHTQC